MRKTIYHSKEWLDHLVSTYGYEDVSFISDKIFAPVLKIPRSFFGGGFAVSLPFSDEAGPFFENEDEVVVSKYFSHLSNLLDAKDLSYIELKGLPKSLWVKAELNGFQKIYRNFTFRIDLKKPLDEIKAGFHKNIKRNLKKENIFEVVDGSASLYYPLHQVTMKNLGTPPHSMMFFSGLKHRLGENAKMFFAMAGGKPAAAIVMLYDKSKYCARYIAGVTDPRFRQKNPNSFLFLEAISLAHAEGFEYFDFGVSREGSGVWDFKRKWTKSEPLEVGYFVKGLSDKYIDPRKGSVSRLSNIWRQFVPLWLANIIGPTIRGAIGK